MRAVEARNLWLGELSTNGASPWAIRNYTGATDAAFSTIAERRQTAASDLELGAVDRDDIVAALAAYVERPDASGVKRKRSQSRVRPDGSLDVTRETVGQVYERAVTAAGLRQKGRASTCPGIHLPRSCWRPAPTSLLAVSSLVTPR